MSTTYTMALATCAYSNGTIRPLDNSPLVWMTGSIASSAGNGAVVQYFNWTYYGLLAHGFAQNGAAGLQKAIASVMVGAVIAQNSRHNIFVPGFSPIDVSGFTSPFTPPPVLANGDVQFGGFSIIALTGANFTVRV